MEKVELAYENFKIPAKTQRLIQDCKEAGDEILSRANGPGCIPQFEPADGRISWNLLNSVRKQLLVDDKPVFCEWGSGLGLVTMLASTAGMTASGVEIEEELVDLACEISVQHDLPATFINASIYPADKSLPAVDYKNVHLFFAYPWPAEISRIIELFNEVAASSAILVCYHGGQNYRVLRR